MIQNIIPIQDGLRELIEIKEEDIVFSNGCFPTKRGIIIPIDNVYNSEPLKKQIIANQKLRQLVEGKMKQYEHYKDSKPSYDYDIYHFCESLLDEANN